MDIKRFSELLTVLFVGLKLTDQIEWSWWIVCSPLAILLCVQLLFAIGKLTAAKSS